MLDQPVRNIGVIIEEPFVEDMMKGSSVLFLNKIMCHLSVDDQALSTAFKL